MQERRGEGQRKKEREKVKERRSEKRNKREQILKGAVEERGWVKMKKAGKERSQRNETREKRR